jgi:fatty acid desaturase
LFFGTWVTLCQFLYKVLAPYFVVRFLLTPLPFFVANYLFNGGSSYAMNALWSLLLAEVATNVHSFVVIATNHAGDDLYRFNVHCKPHSGTFYLRQVLSSANFSCGDDLTDFMHGWLNYQVEHHLWPQLSALSYQKAQPEVAAICAKYGVPYVQVNPCRLPLPCR